MIAEQHTLTILGLDGAEALLAFGQRAVRQIVAITVEQVKGDEARLPTPEQEIIKEGLPVAVETHDLVDQTAMISDLVTLSGSASPSMAA